MCPPRPLFRYLTVRNLQMEVRMGLTHTHTHTCKSVGDEGKGITYQRLVPTRNLSRPFEIFCDYGPRVGVSRNNLPDLTPDPGGWSTKMSRPFRLFATELSILGKSRTEDKWEVLGPVYSEEPLLKGSVSACRVLIKE